MSGEKHSSFSIFIGSVNFDEHVGPFEIHDLVRTRVGRIAQAIISNVHI